MEELILPCPCGAEHKFPWSKIKDIYETGQEYEFGVNCSCGIRYIIKVRHPKRAFELWEEEKKELKVEELEQEIKDTLELLEVIKSQFYTNMPRIAANMLLKAAVLNYDWIKAKTEQQWTSGSDSDS